MNRTDKFLSLAVEEAKQSDMRYKHGAVIVKGGHVVAKGHNSRRSRVEGENYCNKNKNEKNKKNKKNANKHRPKRVKGCDIYVVRLDGENMGESRPCHLCLEWLRQCGVRRVFFSVRQQQETGQIDNGYAVSGTVRWVKQTVEDLCAQQQYITSSERYLASRAAHGRWHEPPNH